MFTLQTSFNPFLEVSRVTVSSKQENSSDFCPNYVQEFGIRRL
jgi:hypothetical protein